MPSSGILDDSGRTDREQFCRTAHHNRRREPRVPECVRPAPKMCQFLSHLLPL